MKYFVSLVIASLISFLPKNVFAQRISDNNTITWMNSQNTIFLNKKISLALEYQWRREGVFTDWQQSLSRGGIQYHFKNGITAAIGYGYIVTYPYGDYYPGPFSFPEHRIHEQLVWNDAIGRVGLNHRIRLEQRFMGQVNQKAAEYELVKWNLWHRVRYQIRATVPLNNNTLQDKTWYAAAFDELFIGFGKNVNQNIFDQNRIGLLLGYQFNKTVRAEAGYFNQTLQQSALVNGNEIFQYNNGVLVSVFLSLNN